MPVSLAKLEKAKITQETLKAKFARAYADKDGKIKKLTSRIFDRIQQGRNFNFDNYKVYHAIDLLWETPMRAQDAALMRTLAGRDFSKDGNKKIVEEWALTHLLVDRTDPKTNKTEKVLNLPRFLNVIVPLAASTTKTRVAKLTNDRMQYPLFKYDARKSTPQNMARCELLTDYVETVSTWFDYRNLLQQAILKCCQYPNQLMFPQESWFKEEQDGELVKEGVRYRLPHPARAYYDLSHPISSFNTDTGCQFAGYWRIIPYRDLMGSTELWNTEAIHLGADWKSAHSVYFDTVYPCTLQPPHLSPGFSENDREQKNMTMFSSSYEDSGVVVTEHHERIIPSDYGLGNYDSPVWFRFLVAADNTVLYCEPLTTCGITYWGYDPDDSRLISPSLIQEAAPWEYLVSNLLTQLVVSVRQNFANLTFYDSDMVDEKVISSLKDINDTSFNTLRMVPMSGKRFRAQQTDISESIHTVQLPQRETVGVMNAISMALNIMERCFVMSSQEVGSAANHEQSAEEVRLIATNTSTRLEYTGLAIDRAIEAWKRQLYYCAMEHGSEEVYGYVSADRITREQLEKMGLTVNDAESSSDHFKVSGNRTAMAMQVEYFAASRDGANRSNNGAVANQMVQMLAPLIPQLAQAAGPEQLVGLFNQWAEMAGLPRSYRLKMGTVTSQSDPSQTDPHQQQMAAMVQQIRAFVEQSIESNTEGMMKEVSDKMFAPLAQAVQQSGALGQSNQQVVAKLIETLKGLTNGGPGTAGASDAGGFQQEAPLNPAAGIAAGAAYPGGGQGDPAMVDPATGSDVPFGA